MYEPGFTLRPGDRYRRATVIASAKFYPRLGLGDDAFTYKEDHSPEGRYDTGRHLLLLEASTGYMSGMAEHQFSYLDSFPATLGNEPMPRFVAEADFNRLVKQYRADSHWEEAQPLTEVSA